MEWFAQKSLQMLIEMGGANKRICLEVFWCSPGCVLDCMQRYITLSREANWNYETQANREERNSVILT